MNYAGPLTPHLLRERTVELFAACIAAAGEVDEVIFDRVICDGCGLVINRLRDGDPVGWTTSGSRERGWRDLCAICTAREGEA